MSMTRSDAIEYLAGRLRELLADTGITPDTAGLNDVVDESLLLMGVADDDLSTAQVFGYRRVLRWQALERFADAMTPRGNVSISAGTPNISKSVSPGPANDLLLKRLAVAKQEAAPYLVAANDGAFSTGTVRLGAMEECGWAF
jgi:hypothetical protein